MPPCAMLRRDSCCNASVFVIKNSWGKLPIQWQEPIPCPRNTELPAQTIDDETRLRVEWYDRERLAVRKSVKTVLLKFSPRHKILTVGANTRDASLAIESPNMVHDGYTQARSCHRLWIRHGHVKNVKTEESARISHPVPDYVCRRVDLQTALTLVDDGGISRMPGLARAHDRSFLGIPQQQATELLRLCKHVCQLVETLVNGLRIRLSPTEPLQYFGGDKLEHER